MNFESKKTLLSTLNILKKGREYSIAQLFDTYNLRNSIKYRKSSAIIDLIIDRYHTDFLNYHFELINGENESVKTKVSKVIYAFIERELCIKNTELGHNLLIEKRKVIEDMLYTASNMEKKYQQILVSIERDKAKFEDMVERIDVEQNKV